MSEPNDDKKYRYLNCIETKLGGFFSGCKSIYQNYRNISVIALIVIALLMVLLFRAMIGETNLLGFISIGIVFVMAWITTRSVNRQIQSDKEEREKDRISNTRNSVLLRRMEKLEEVRNLIQNWQFLTSSRLFEDRWMEIHKYLRLDYLSNKLPDKSYYPSAEFFQATAKVQRDVKEIGEHVDSILKVYFPNRTYDMANSWSKFNNRSKEINIYFEVADYIAEELEQPPEDIKTKASNLRDAFQELTKSLLKIIHEEGFVLLREIE